MEQYIVKKLDDRSWLYALPLGMTIIAGVMAVPMVYNIGLAQLTNDYLVSAEVASPDKLETIWETSIWSWKWMSPVLATGAFVHLSVVLVDKFMMKLGKPTWDNAEKTSLKKELWSDDVICGDKYNKRIVARLVMAIPRTAISAFHDREFHEEHM